MDHCDKQSSEFKQKYSMNLFSFMWEEIVLKT